MRKDKNSIKNNLLVISLSLGFLVGFIVGLISSIAFFAPFLKRLGPDPNLLIVFCVVLPLLIVFGIIFGYVGFILCLLLWKPVLTQQEVDEYIYKQILFRRGLVVKKKDIRFIKDNIRKRPYYIVMAILILIAYAFDRLNQKIITAIYPKD